MLLIAPDTLRKNQALNDVVREMSFALSVFAKPSTFAELMTGQLRRIVMLTDADVTEHTLQSLKAANGRTLRNRDVLVSLRKVFVQFG